MWLCVFAVVCCVSPRPASLRRGSALAGWVGSCPVPFSVLVLGGAAACCLGWVVFVPRLSSPRSPLAYLSYEIWMASGTFPILGQNKEKKATLLKQSGEGVLQGLKQRTPTSKF